jgi:hypothetical protein
MEQAVAEVEVIELTAAAAPFDDVDVQQWARHVFQEVRVQRVSRAAGKPHSSAAGAGGARTFYWWMLAAALLALALA